jgi:hypothetical protein
MQSLLPKAAKAAAVQSKLATTASGAPLRTAFVFFPNGAILDDWWPTNSGNSGSGLELSKTLAPLEKLKNQVQILKGLDNESAESGNDGAGDHARGNGTFLTCVRIKKSATDIRAGQSIDQAIASRVGGTTRYKSLELASDPNRQSNGCDSGYSCAYQYNISWQSSDTPMATECNPRLVFERMFGSGGPGQRAKSLAQRRQSRQSILDFVREDALSMQRRMQRTDRQKLDEYLTGVRSLEKRIERSESFGQVIDPKMETPIGIPKSHQEHVQLMYELSVLAFQTDSTRVLSLMLGHDGDNRSYKFLGVTEGHHDLSHHRNQKSRKEKVQRIDQWYVQQFALFLERLKQTKDVDGNSVLHNSMIVMGSGNADGNRHSHSDLPMLLAGGGGGQLKPGRFVDHKGTPLSNLYVRLAQNMGVESLESFGDSNGMLDI